MSEIEWTSASCIEHDAAASGLMLLHLSKASAASHTCHAAVLAMLAEAARSHAMPVSHLHAHGQTAPQVAADHWPHLHDVAALLQAGPQAR